MRLCVGLLSFESGLLLGFSFEIRVHCVIDRPNAYNPPSPPPMCLWTESAWHQMISLLLLCLQCSRKANFTVKWLFKSDMREEQDGLKKGARREGQGQAGDCTVHLCALSYLKKRITVVSSPKEYSGRNTVESAKADELNLV